MNHLIYDLKCWLKSGAFMAPTTKVVFVALGVWVVYTLLQPSLSDYKDNQAAVWCRSLGYEECHTVCSGPRCTVRTEDGSTFALMCIGHSCRQVVDER